MIRLAGAELVQVPAAPYKNPNNYVRYSERLANALARTTNEGVIWANQFDNVANRQAHIETTGPEIWEQTDGKVDGFICAVGSGGTLAGVGMALQPKGVKIGLADPMGAALHSYYTTGELKSEGSSITEGIGQGRITANLEGFKPDYSYQVTDKEALPVVFDLLRDEGLCLGGSSGINVAGAMKMARDMGPGNRIVTILCDYGTRYQSKLFNPEFLHEMGLPVPQWLARAPQILPDVYELMRHAITRLILILALCLPLAAVAQDIVAPDYDTWEGVASRAETAVEGGAADDATLDALRTDLAKWRDQFLSAEGINAARISTLRAQVATLGEPPAEGAEEPRRCGGAAQRAQRSTRPRSGAGAQCRRGLYPC